jgi:hypothetical protein
MRLGWVLVVCGCLSDLTPTRPETQTPMTDAAMMKPDMAEAVPIDPDPTCGQQSFPVDFTRTVPNVMLVVDDSGSMAEVIPAPPMVPQQTKWEAARAAVKSLLTKYPDAVNWGLSIFPQPGASDLCAPGVVDVPVGAGTSVSILQKIEAINGKLLNGSTPTPETLAAIQAANVLKDPIHENFLVLLTDGVPSCAAAGGVTSVLQALYAQTPSVKSFIIGFGNETNSNPTLLDEWAEAGHTARAATPKYFQANSLGDLTTAFDSILGAVASCNYALTETPADPMLLTAYLDGQAVALDPVNGATYDEATQSLVFHGSACDRIKGAQVEKIEVVYGCPAPTVS